MFVSNDVPKGQEIDAYTGDVKTQEQLEKDLTRRGKEAARYDIDLKPLPDGFNGGPLYIDAFARGNKTRFVNHCCEPNCEFEKWQREVLHIIKAVAKQNIRVATE